MHLRDRFARLRPVLHDWSLHTAWVMVCGAILWAIREPDRIPVMAVYLFFAGWFLYLTKRREAGLLRRSVLILPCIYIATLAGNPTSRPPGNDEWITWFFFRQQVGIVLSEMAVFLGVGALVLLVRWLLPAGSRLAARASSR